MTTPLTRHTGHLVEGMRKWSTVLPSNVGWWLWRKSCLEAEKPIWIECDPELDELYPDIEEHKTLIDLGGEWSDFFTLPSEAPAQGWYREDEVAGMAECLHDLLVYIQGIEQPFKDAFPDEYRMPSVITNAKVWIDRLKGGV